jgi:hypothetical protein
MRTAQSEGFLWAWWICEFVELIFVCSLSSDDSQYERADPSKSPDHLDHIRHHLRMTILPRVLLLLSDGLLFIILVLAWYVTAFTPTTCGRFPIFVPVSKVNKQTNRYSQEKFSLNNTISASLDTENRRRIHERVKITPSSGQKTMS